MKRQRIKPEQFKNPSELRTYKQLKSMQQNFRYRIEYETKDIAYVIKLDKVYRPDFIVTMPDGREVYIEFKGYLRREDEVKLLNVKQQHPEIDLRIVFEKDNKLVGRKSRYSDWAKKNGFTFAIGEVPKEWFLPS